MPEPFEGAAVLVGTELPPLHLRITRAHLVRYAGASTDFNPIHYSDHAAQALGLDGVIAHGMLVMGAALRVVTDWVGDPGAVRSYFVRFTHPVAVPDDDEGTEVRCTATVVAVQDGKASIAIQAAVVDAAGNPQSVLGAAKAEVAL